MEKKKPPEGFKRISDIKRSASKEGRREGGKERRVFRSRVQTTSDLLVGEDEEKLLECGLGDVGEGATLFTETLAPLADKWVDRQKLLRSKEEVLASKTPRKLYRLTTVEKRQKFELTRKAKASIEADRKVNRSKNLLRYLVRDSSLSVNICSFTIAKVIKLTSSPTKTSILRQTYRQSRIIRLFSGRNLPAVGEASEEHDDEGNRERKRESEAAGCIKVQHNRNETTKIRSQNHLGLLDRKKNDDAFGERMQLNAGRRRKDDRHENVWDGIAKGVDTGHRLRACLLLHYITQTTLWATLCPSSIGVFSSDDFEKPKQVKESYLPLKILCGCGYLDGTEISEAVSSAIHICQKDMVPRFYAPDIDICDTVDHSTKQSDSKSPSRNGMVEAARLARSEIKPLCECKACKHEALVLPGGFGAAKTLLVILGKKLHKATVTRRIVPQQRFFASDLSLAKIFKVSKKKNDIMTWLIYESNDCTLTTCKSKSRNNVMMLEA
ncbi:hypothetical protein WN51_00884 [Melipona quadrifasciata]|uniref:Uncharacterized protein n=1 Tax=Melipona quadrifasciata TaxID=166423 RepID=A0A0M9ACD5_9HYME|nr:hypothetical protein WN51_00884 [Melipona quadrifasciata]